MDGTLLCGRPLTTAKGKELPGREGKDRCSPPRWRRKSPRRPGRRRRGQLAARPSGESVANEVSREIKRLGEIGKLKARLSEIDVSSGLSTDRPGGSRLGLLNHLSKSSSTWTQRLVFNALVREVVVKSRTDARAYFKIPPTKTLLVHTPETAGGRIAPDGETPRVCGCGAGVLVTL